MKRIAVISCILVLLTLAAYLLYTLYTNVSSPGINNESSPLTTPKPLLSITVNNEQYNYSYFFVQNPADISLLSNFSERKDSKTLASEHLCQQYVNGGFYDTEGKPLGLFIFNHQTLSPRIQSNLLNGFVWINDAGNAGITDQLPGDSLRLAVQTGPFVLQGGKPLTLRINNDEHSRRTVAAKTSKNTLLFLTLYNGDSVFSGPLLGDLPEALDAVNQKERLNLTDAVNLDGGSASAFYNGTTALSELTPVGSLFCLK